MPRAIGHRAETKVSHVKLNHPTVKSNISVETDLPRGSVLHTADHVALESSRGVKFLLLLRDLRIDCCVNRLRGIETSS